MQIVTFYFFKLSVFESTSHLQILCIYIFNNYYHLAIFIDILLSYMA